MRILSFYNCIWHMRLQIVLLPNISQILPDNHFTSTILLTDLDQIVTDVSCKTRRSCKVCKYNYGTLNISEHFELFSSWFGAWDSEQHIAQATEILISFIKEIKAKFPMWSQEQCFKGGISAYNAGVSTVSSYENIDARTSGKDFSNDVVARAQWFKSKGY
uniref:Lysozyme g n=1 Tax=Cyprinus carpio TaxID=7962 RepID=A0A8C2HMU7_CYPCA